MGYGLTILPHMARQLAARVHQRLHRTLKRHHARHHHTRAPANARMHESLSVIEHLALVITQGVGTMYCAGIFLMLSLISLPAALATHDPIIIVAWIAQTCLQLVLLPVIIVGQNLQARHTELRAEADHDINQQNTERILTVLARIEAHEHHQDAQDEHLGRQDALLVSVDENTKHGMLALLERVEGLEAQRAVPIVAAAADAAKEKPRARQRAAHQRTDQANQ